MPSSHSVVSSSKRQALTSHCRPVLQQELNPASYADSIRYVFQNGLLGDEDVPPELRRQDEHNARRQADLRPMDVDGSDDEAGPSTKAEVKAEGSNANEFDLAWGVGLKKKTAEKAQPVVGRCQTPCARSKSGS